MLIHKDPLKQREITQCDPRLRKILSVINILMWLMWGDDCVVTSVYRNDVTTHSNPPPYRFLDVAIPPIDGIRRAEVIRQVINILFPYGAPGYQTIPEIRHGTAPHLHVQVRPQ